MSRVLEPLGQEPRDGFEELDVVRAEGVRPV